MITAVGRDINGADDAVVSGLGRILGRSLRIAGRAAN